MKNLVVESTYMGSVVKLVQLIKSVQLMKLVLLFEGLAFNLHHYRW